MSESQVTTKEEWLKSCAGRYIQQLEYTDEQAQFAANVTWGVCAADVGELNVIKEYCPINAADDDIYGG